MCVQVQPLCPPYWPLCAAMTCQDLSTPQETLCTFISPQTAASVHAASTPPTPEVIKPSVFFFNVFQAFIYTALSSFCGGWLLVTSSSPGCGGLLHTDRGVLNSPRYPQSYLPSQSCSWHVMVTPGFRISVTFQSPFQVQGYGTHCSTGDYLEVQCLRFCRILRDNSVPIQCHCIHVFRIFDFHSAVFFHCFVKVRNGPDGSAPLLGERLCGGTSPNPLQTTDNHLFISFVSDTSNEGSGFKLVFEAHSQGTAAALFVAFIDLSIPSH